VADLFVSYKSEDRARVAPLVAALEADGIALWWDAHLGGGSAWRDEIERNLNAAKCVLVVWSTRATGPDGSFVRDEATRASRRGVYLPVRIDPVEPPLGFGETQALTLTGWKGERTDPRYQAVLAAARAVIAGKPRQTAAGTPAAQKSGIDRRLVIGGGVVVAATAGTGGWWALHHGPGAAQDSVAVLPFANLSGDPAQAYFSDGIAEELRGALTRIVRLKVAARTSSELMRNADGPTAAARLGVANIVTGSVRRGAGTIRVSAELIDGSSGLSRWSQSYDRAIGDALTIETGIAESVANALNLTLGHADKALLTTGGTTSAVAQDAFLRGQQLVNAENYPANDEPALQAFDAAIAADPRYAPPRTARAFLIAGIASHQAGGADLRARLTEAEAEARRAVALAPGLGGPLAALSYALECRLDLAGAAKTATAAYKATPGDVDVVEHYVEMLSIFGRSDEALRLLDRARSLDPLRPVPLGLRATYLREAGKIDEAITLYRQQIAQKPDGKNAPRWLAMCYLIKRQPRDALLAAAPLAAGSWQRLTIEAIAAAQLGNRAASDAALATLVRDYATNAQYQIVEVHAQRGEIDLAFAAIALAWNLADSGLTYFKTDQLLAPLHGDPRFAAWLRKIGFP
jgi:serine/threonine-protein kinase